MLAQGVLWRQARACGPATMCVRACVANEDMPSIAWPVIGGDAIRLDHITLDQCRGLSAAAHLRRAAAALLEMRTHRESRQAAMNGMISPSNLISSHLIRSSELEPLEIAWVPALTLPAAKLGRRPPQTSRPVCESFCSSVAKVQAVECASADSRVLVHNACVSA